MNEIKISRLSYGNSFFIEELCVLCSFVILFTDCLIDWSIDGRLIDGFWPAYWLTDWLIDWLIDYVMRKELNSRMMAFHVLYTSWWNFKPFFAKIQGKIIKIDPHQGLRLLFAQATWMFLILLVISQLPSLLEDSPTTLTPSFTLMWAAQQLKNRCKMKTLQEIQGVTCFATNFGRATVACCCIRVIFIVPVRCDLGRKRVGWSHA